MTKLFLTEFDGPVHLIINGASRYTRYLRQAVMKNTDYTDKISFDFASKDHRIRY